jgi:hypothetical protein
MTWNPPPPMEIDLTGHYLGDAYPTEYEYRVHVVAESEDQWRISTATADGALLDSMVLMADDAQQVRTAAATAMRWPIPGLSATPSWQVALDSTVHYVVLNSGHLDEIASWLEFWLGEAEWDGGEEWVW